MQAGNFDEYKVEALVKDGAPCDMVVMCTEFTSVSDSPKLEIVYKLAELRDAETVEYAAKFATGKVSYPGRKQVFRTQTDDRVVARDVLGLEDETDLGKPVLRPIVEHGELVYPLPNLDEIRQYIDDQLNQLPTALKQLTAMPSFPVSASEKLSQLLEQVRQQKMNQAQTDITP